MRTREQTRYTFGFCIKRTRLNSEGKAPIYLRITIDKDRREKAINLFVSPCEWDGKFELCRGKDKFSASINQRLSVIRSKVLEYYTALSSTGHNPTAEEVMNKFLGIEPSSEKKYFLLELFKEHNLKCEELFNSGHNCF